MTTLALLCSARAPAGVLLAVHDLAQRCLWRKLSSLPAAPLEVRSALPVLKWPIKIAIAL